MGGTALALAGCATPGPGKYTEKVSSILVTADGKTIVFLGAHYTYIFEAPAQLISAFKASFYPALSADMDFKVLVYNKKYQPMSGTIVLTVADSASLAQKEAAMAAGYRKASATAYYQARAEPVAAQLSDTTYNLLLKLDGKRFGATNTAGMALQKLNRSYEVSVSEAHVAKDPDEPSPLQVGLNGVLYLGALALFSIVYAGH